MEKKKMVDPKKGEKLKKGEYLQAVFLAHKMGAKDVFNDEEFSLLETLLQAHRGFSDNVLILLSYWCNNEIERRKRFRENPIGSIHR